MAYWTANCFFLGLILGLSSYDLWICMWLKSKMCISLMSADFSGDCSDFDDIRLMHILKFYELLRDVSKMILKIIQLVKKKLPTTYGLAMFFPFIHAAFDLFSFRLPLLGTRSCQGSGTSALHLTKWSSRKNLYSRNSTGDTSWLMKPTESKMNSPRWVYIISGFL